MKKNHLIFFLLISLIGFTAGTYLKYFKTYQNEIQISHLSNNGELTHRQLRLSENISFLEKQNKTLVLNGIEKVKEDKAHEALKSLKAVNKFSIVIILLSSLTFFWSIPNFIRKEYFYEFEKRFGKCKFHSSIRAYFK